MKLILMALVMLLLLIMAVPIWLAVMSAIGFAMPWLIFGLVAWAFVAMSRGPREHRWERHSWQSRSRSMSRAPHPSQPRPDPRPQPPQRPPAPRSELPIDVQVKVEQIRRKVEVLLGYASRFPPFSQDLYIVRQTASDYLPRTIDAFLALPAGEDDRIVAANGEAALQELKGQLDLLDSKLNEIAEDLQRHDLDRLLANRRFLEERFGQVRT